MIKKGLYNIPNNWCWSRLGKITSVIGGGTPSSKISEYYDNGDIAWITPSDLSNYNNMYISNGKKMITKLGLMKSSAKLLPKGTVCLSSRAPIGYVVIAKNELSTNQGFKSFLPSKAFKSEYLYWYLKSIKHILEAKASGTTFLELSAKKAGEVEIPLPPINEQQRIVNRIDSLFTKLYKAKELIENTLAQFEQNKMAILDKAFTGELTAKWRKENNIDLSSWKICELKEVFEVVKDKYNPQNEKQIVNYIGLENIETNRGIVSKNDSSEVKSIKTKFKKNDVLYGKLRPYLNKHDVANFDGICSTDILVFRFNNINTAKYINYYFNLPIFVQYVVKNSNGINLPRVSEKIINKYKIKLPNIEEQQEIVNILDELLAKYNKIKDLEKQLEQIELLKKAILAKAFRGELGTNNPDEESAEVLLKEILAEK